MKRSFQYTMVFVLAFTTINAFAQADQKNYDTVSTYIHIPRINLYSYEKPFAFVLRNIDSLGKVNWLSGIITRFEKDGEGYLANVNAPSSILKNSKEMWCTALVKRGKAKKPDTVQVNYGGVQLSKIKLILKSTPVGAESFLIPNRIWLNKIQNLNWGKDSAYIEKFRVNTSSTDTYAYIDETVYVVLYKMNNTFKQTIHYTKPASIEDQQIVWVKF